jgi:hypothetical protein
MELLKQHWQTAVMIGCLAIAAFLQAWPQAAKNASVGIPKLQGRWNLRSTNSAYHRRDYCAKACHIRRKKPDQALTQTSQPEIMAGIPQYPFKTTRLP